jgi:hypothetical protein
LDWFPYTYERELVAPPQRINAKNEHTPCLDPSAIIAEEKEILPTSQREPPKGASNKHTSSNIDIAKLL